MLTKTPMIATKSCAISTIDITPFLVSKLIEIGKLRISRRRLQYQYLQAPDYIGKPDRPPSDIPNGHYNRWALFASTYFSGRYTWRACWQRYPEHEAWSYTRSLILTETSCRSRYPDEIISPALKSGHQNALFSSMFVNFAVPVKLVFTPFLPKFTN